MSRFDIAVYQTRLLHVYRQLLRECGYLPDHIARQETTRQTRNRFRIIQNRISDSSKTSSNATGADVAVETFERRLKTASSTLKTLRNANSGGQLSLAKVLFYAYGRTGRRRHELLAPFLDGVKTHQVLEPGQSGYILHLPVSPVFDSPSLLNDRETLQFGISQRYSAFKMLVDSQLATYGALERKPPFIGDAYGKRLRKVTFNVSKLNIWKRPLPQKRAKNMLNRYFLNLEKLILPPIPQEEWAHLQSLVQGDKPFQLIPRRKAIVGQKSLTAIDLEKFLDVVQHGGSIIPSAQLSHRRSIVAQHINSQDKWLEDEDALDLASNDILLSELSSDVIVPIKRNKKDDPHTLTQRYLRRAYARVFNYCCLMQKETSSVKIIWGQQLLNENKPIVGMDSLYSMVTNGPSDIVSSA
jgi:hypothetical protein